MHFAALVALAVIASSVPSLAASSLPPRSHLQANPKRDPYWAKPWAQTTAVIIDDSTPSPVPSVQHVNSKTSLGEVFVTVYATTSLSSRP
ncbi:hypothetical protein DFJ58DRAFT_730045 [Suillus subalutaceus]|uniref:uncharacterized protein n=1 Tax=Suillus subalutaceus TaxID=48586 RepID=UPI001B86A637|nr:uncharacterized protein DFJ58DRAFT_730045 [Suillus subalutaceus]KAG1847872.1 hypothetical protein DFJ58DRAFT_730045 [Suillus subalutaceus]